jgi:outer membrane protein assembly factor BamB
MKPNGRLLIFGACGLFLILMACGLSLLLPALLISADEPARPLGATAPQPADSWPVFRGNPTQTGVVPTALPDQLAVLWTFATKDSIEGAPAVAGDFVFVGSMDENLYAVDLCTGKEKWQYKGGAFKASPAVKGTLVFLGDMDGHFHCVDAAKGEKRWTFDTGAEITSGANFDGDRVLFGSYDETLYCLGPDGKPVWKVKTDGPVNGSPAVAQGRTFVAGCDSSVHVIELATGKELAAIELEGQAAATAAVVGDLLYVGTMGNKFMAIDWNKKNVDWTFAPERRAQPFYASAAVTDKLAVVGSRDKNLYALDRKTGKEVWTHATQGRVDASPVIAGNRVYASSLDGNLYVLDLATGKVLQKLTLDSPVTGSPAVSKGCLFVGTQKGTLYCLGAKK